MYTPTAEKWPGVASVATRTLLGRVEMLMRAEEGMTESWLNLEDEPREEMRRERELIWLSSCACFAVAVTRVVLVLVAAGVETDLADEGRDVVSSLAGRAEAAVLRSCLAAEAEAAAKEGGRMV